MVEDPIAYVEEEEEKRALKRMENGNAPKPSSVSSDVLKLSGMTGIRKLTRAFKKIMREEKNPEEWKDSFTLPIIMIHDYSIF